MTEIKYERTRLVYATDQNKICLKYPVSQAKAFEFMTLIKAKYPYRQPDLQIIKNEIERFFNQ